LPSQEENNLMRRPRVPAYSRVASVFLLLLFSSAWAQAGPASGNEGASEHRTTLQLDAVRGNPLALRAFLVAMPKGADLHNHLSGAFSAEFFIRAAAKDTFFVDPVSTSFAKPLSMSAASPPQPVCGDGRVSAASAFKNQHLYDALVD